MFAHAFVPWYALVRVLQLKENGWESFALESVNPS